MVISKTLKGLLCLLTLTIFVSCGSSSSMVSDVKVSTASNEDGDILVSLTADLNIGNVQIPAASLPIILPKDGREVGTVSITADALGQNVLVIDINLSDAANLELAAVRLPNGSIIPLIADNAVLEIPLGKAKVLLSLAEGSQALGVVLPISALDKVGAKVGTAVLAPAFSKDGVMGAAGVYTSKTAGQNGFVLVADISSKMGGISIPNANVNKMQMQQAPLEHGSVEPSRRVKRKLQRELLRMHRKKAVMEVN